MRILCFAFGLGAFQCFLLVPSDAFAQHYGKYHKAVNNAEQQMVIGHKDSALHWYRMAFRDYDFIFAKDAVNAAQIALRTPRPERADSFLLKGAASGLRLKFLANIPRLAEYVSVPGKEALRQRMTELSGRFTARSDQALTREWKERYREEQTAKNAYHTRQEFLVYREIVQRNVAAVVKLWKTRHVLPGDRVLGLRNDGDEIEQTWAFYSLAHYDCVASTLEDMLWEAVESGMLHPREFAALWAFERLRSPGDSTRKTNPGCTAVMKKFNSAWFSDTDSATLAEVKRNRAKYWLCSHETDLGLSTLARTEGYKFRYSYY